MSDSDEQQQDIRAMYNNHHLEIFAGDNLVNIMIRSVLISCHRMLDTQMKLTDEPWTTLTPFFDFIVKQAYVNEIVECFDKCLFKLEYEDYLKDFVFMQREHLFLEFKIDALSMFWREIVETSGYLDEHREFLLGNWFMTSHYFQIWELCEAALAEKPWNPKYGLLIDLLYEVVVKSLIFAQHYPEYSVCHEIPQFLSLSEKYEDYKKQQAT